MKLQGKIKTILFKGERVSVLLEDARVFTANQTWKAYLDVELVKGGKYKKGETWLSSFEKPIYEACRELNKGAEVEVGVVVSERGFKNIQSIGLKLPEVDVNEDLVPPDMPTGASGQPPEELFPGEEIPDKIAIEPSTTVDTGKIMAEIEANAREVLIIRQTCIKATGSAIEVKDDAGAETMIDIAKRLEKYVLEGK